MLPLMERYPNNLEELEKNFSTEEACRRYLFDLRWPDGFRCPACGCADAWGLADGLFKCKECGRKTSTIAGTIFEGTRKPLVSWFRAIWWVTCQKNGASALGLKRILGLGSYQTAWTWLHKLRRAMVRPGQDRLSGTLQIDETFIGGAKPGKRGRGAEGKVLVLIVAQEKGKGTGRIRLRLIPDAKAKTLESAVLETIELGSKLKTDGWTGYNGLSALGYQHEVIRESADVGANLLPLCHQEASLIKGGWAAHIKGRSAMSTLATTLTNIRFVSTGAPHARAGCCSIAYCRMLSLWTQPDIMRSFFRSEEDQSTRCST